MQIHQPRVRRIAQHADRWAAWDIEPQFKLRFLIEVDQRDVEVFYRLAEAFNALEFHNGSHVMATGIR